MTLRVIPTRDHNGNINGELIPIVNNLTDAPITQGYITTVKPGMSKGPHLHMRRGQRYVCIKGTVLIITRPEPERYKTWLVHEGTPCIVNVPPGVPSEIRGAGPEEARVLNLPYGHAWSAEDPDDHPVADWNPPQ